MEITVNKEKFLKLIDAIDCPTCPMFYDGCGCALDMGAVCTKTCADMALEFVEDEQTRLRRLVNEIFEEPPHGMVKVEIQRRE